MSGETQNTSLKEHERMSVAALFTVAQTWKQPTCPSVDEWVEELPDEVTMEYYLAIKRSEILPFVTANGLADSVLRETSQRKTDNTGLHLCVESGEQSNKQTETASCSSSRSHGAPPSPESPSRGPFSELLRKSPPGLQTKRGFAVCHTV